MISIVFPIFFGLILGDVGYGVLLLILCLGLRKFVKGEAGITTIGAFHVLAVPV